MNRRVAPLPRLDAVDEAFRADVREGLSRRPRRLPPKWFYDGRGAALFEAICRTPEYYVTRVEKRLLAELAPELRELAGSRRVLVEPGCGSSEKARLLVEALRPSAYVPVDICAAYVEAARHELARHCPGLPVMPVCADFAHLPALAYPPGRRLVFFPGSTIGNLEPEEAAGFLGSLAACAGEGGGLLIGVDLKKHRAVLEAAYNDAAGVTAAFNRNLLVRINRELGADFAPDAFAHLAFYDEARGCIEMHLVSRRPQEVRVDGERHVFAAGESIHTENSYKYTVDEFRALAARAGWRHRRVWCDGDGLFSVHYLDLP
ncbi:MAG: L-histidine N(alpha)-methyltransferase [Thiohalomonadaceae bacterium]